MPQTIQQLREKRASKAREARRILDHAGDNFSPRDASQVDALYGELDTIDSQIRAHQRVLDAEVFLDEPDDEYFGRRRSLRTGRSVDEETSVGARERRIFSKWLRGGDKGLTRDDIDFLRRPRADQATQPGSAGGYTVPREFAGFLIERMKQFGGIRSVATVIQTTGGNPMDFPTVDETNEEGELVPENQPATPGQFVFGTKALGAYKYSSKVIAISIELLQDEQVDLVGFVSRALATRIARITSRHFVTGTGVDQPRGWTGDSPAVPQGAAGPIVYEDLVALEHSIDPAYRNSPSVRWAFHDTTLRGLKLLKDDAGRPLWMPGLSASFERDFPDTILGYRYSIQQEMATMADPVGAKVLGFGDFSKYYIRDVMAATLFRFEDSAFMIKGQVGFLAWSRHDGDRLDVNFDAIKVLTKA